VGTQRNEKLITCNLLLPIKITDNHTFRTNELATEFNQISAFSIPKKNIICVKCEIWPFGGWLYLIIYKDVWIQHIKYYEKKWIK